MASNIDYQIARDYGTINNISHQENNYFDDPLDYYFKKEMQNNSALYSLYEVIKYIVNKDRLKERFKGVGAKYEELAKMASKFIKKDSTGIIASDGLDDGYKSVITSILNIAAHFEKSNNSLAVKDNNTLTAEIKSVSLKLHFFDGISTHREYNEAKSFADKIKNNILPYLNCSESYGRFLQFNDVYIEPLENIRFIDREIKFHVSDEIIPKLIEPLYGDSPECGLREIVQNACDACKVMQNSYGQNAGVSISLNKTNESENWKLTVRDYGIGMDEEILANSYFVVGESTKRDLTENVVGQFGIGVLACFLLGNRMSVRTKKVGQNTVLSFDYVYGLNNNERSVDVKKEIDDSFKFGTELTITLRDSFTTSSIEEVEDSLKINEWYVMPDVDLEYMVNGEVRNIRNFKGEDYIWKKVLNEEKLVIEYLYKGKDNRMIGGDKVIYNGILVPENYELNSNYIKYKPLVNIVDSGREMKLDLSRTKLRNPEKFVSQLRNAIYSTIDLNSNEDVQKSIVNQNEILEFNYKQNRFLNNLPLVFSKHLCGIYSTNLVLALKETGNYKKIVKVYRCSESGSQRINITDFEDDCIYVFDRRDQEKSDISDLIEATGDTYIPINTLKSYFYNAKDSYNGFRKDTIQYLYGAFKKELTQQKKSRAIWEYHNDHKEGLFSELFKETTEHSHIRINKSDEIEIELEMIYKVFDNCIVTVSELNGWTSNGDYQIVKDHLPFDKTYYEY